MTKKLFIIGILLILFVIFLIGCNENQKPLDEKNSSDIKDINDNHIFLEWCGNIFKKYKIDYNRIIDSYNDEDYSTTNSLAIGYIDDIWQNMSEIYTFNVNFDYDYQLMFWDYMNATLYGVYYINQMIDSLINNRSFEYNDYLNLYKNQEILIHNLLETICLSLEEEGYPQNWCSL